VLSGVAAAAIREPVSESREGQWSVPLRGASQAAPCIRIPGPNYGSIYTATNAQIAPSLGRNLSGGVRRCRSTCCSLCRSNFDTA